jgi:hypothetical protein
VNKDRLELLEHAPSLSRPFARVFSRRERGV